MKQFKKFKLAAVAGRPGERRGKIEGASAHRGQLFTKRRPYEERRENRCRKF